MLPDEKPQSRKFLLDATPRCLKIGGPGGRWIVVGDVNGSVRVFGWQGSGQDQYREIWRKQLHADHHKGWTEEGVVEVGFIGDIACSAGADGLVKGEDDWCIFFDPRTGEEIERVAVQSSWGYMDHFGDCKWPATWVVAGSPDGRYAFVGSRGGIAICDFRVHLQG